MEFFAELRSTVRQLVCSTQQTCCESMHYAACNVEHARIDSHCTSLSKAVIDLYEPVSDSILKPDLVSWYK